MASSQKTSIQWQCEDKISLEISCEEPFFCGKTFHFTNYAFLITGSEEENAGEPEPIDCCRPETVPYGIIVGVIVAAVILVLIGIIGVVLWRKKLQRAENEDMNLDVPQ